MPDRTDSEKKGADACSGTGMCRLSGLLAGLTLVLLLAALITSCSSVFFDSPQPAERKNLSQVPGKLRGTWKSTSRNGGQEITIDRNSYRNTSVERCRVSKAKAEAPGKYRIEGKMIYVTDEDPSKGYPFSEIDDSLLFEKQYQELLVLSDSILLRKAKKCWVVNLKRGDWWEIVFIQKRKDGEIWISYPFNYDVAELKSAGKVAVLDQTREDSTYFHAQLGPGDIAKIIPKGGGGVLYVLKPDSTFEVPQ